MSRKTRKLIWSAPLVAVLAVAGALAMFVMLAPGGVLAHESGAGIAPHLPPDAVTEIDVTTPTVANGGRTSLRVTWNAPTDGDPVDEYRVDMSYDAHIWHNVIGGEHSTDMLTESMATSNCNSGEDGKRCYTVSGLKPGETYHFRVFAMNEFGTSPISILETIGTGETLPVGPPDTVRGLTATDYFRDKIVLDWQKPADTGGADVKWYCIVIASSPSGDFTDLTDTDNTGLCKTEENATSTAVDVDSLVFAVEDEPQTIVRAAVDDDGDPVTMYEHKGLGGRTAAGTVTAFPHIITLRYRVYAVTEDGAKNRRIALAASNTATGRTLARPDTSPPLAEKPKAPRNLRIVAYGSNLAADLEPTDTVLDDTLTTQVVNFYWNAPTNIDAPGSDDWVIQVERVVPDADSSTGSGWQTVDGTVGTADVTDGVVISPAQWTINPGETAPNFIGASPDKGRFRVRYVNPGADNEVGTEADPSADDVPGKWAFVTLSVPLNGGDHIAAVEDIDDSTLPIITKAVDNGNDVAGNPSGLRFTRNARNPKTKIDLQWQRDVNSHSVVSHKKPNGYVIDRSDDAGVTWEPLYRATDPADLGTATTYIDIADVTPGTRYTYRVFPVVLTKGRTYQDDFGLPAQINASSEEADVPDRVEGLEVEDDGQTALKLTWDELDDSDAGGHPVLGYLVQVADDVDNDGTLEDDAEWTNVGTNADEVDNNGDDFITVGKDADPLEYTYKPLEGDDPELSDGSARWLRVIAITAENDGVVTTGGNQVDITDGSVELTTPSEGEENPTEDDDEIALPVRGETESLVDPDADVDPAAPEKPADLTAEAAFDSNALSDGGRGVFLTWNEVMSETASPIDSYKIERKRMDTGVDALNSDDDGWEFIGRATGDTSFTDSLPLRQDEETRVYRVGSEATGILDVVYVDDPGVTYALHLPHMPDVPMDVMATAGYDSASAWWETLNCRQMVAAVDLAYDGDPNSETGMPGDDSPNADIYCAHYPGSAAVMGGATALTTEATGVVDMKFAEKYPNMGKASIITVKWDAPSDGGSPITGYMVQSKYGDMNWMDVDPAHMGTGAMYIDKNLMSATAYYYQVKAMNAKGDSAWSMMAMQTTGNTDPMAEGAIEAVTLMAGDTSDAMDVSMYFSDADGDTLTYTAMPDMEMYATVAVDGNMVTITGVSAGMATVTVTANDGKGGTVMQPIMVTVPNSAPMAVGTIDPVTVTAGEMSDAMDVSGYFSDADMSDTLTYTAMPDMEMYATVAVDGSMVTITGVSAGMATVTVTANDGKGGIVMQTIMVTVEAADMTPTSPSNVMAIDSGNLMITVTWTDGENVEAYGVVLFNSDFSEWPYIARGMDGSHTFTNVDAGSYVAVVVALNVDGTLLTDANGAYLFGPGNAVTIGQ